MIRIGSPPHTLKETATEGQVAWSPLAAVGRATLGRSRSRPFGCVVATRFNGSKRPALCRQNSPTNSLLAKPLRQEKLCE